MGENSALITAGDVSLLRTTESDGTAKYSIEDRASGALTVFTATSGHNIEGDVSKVYSNCVRLTGTGLTGAIPDSVLSRLDGILDSANVTGGITPTDVSLQSDIRALRSGVVKLLDVDCNGRGDFGNTRTHDSRPLIGK